MMPANRLAIEFYSPRAAKQQPRRGCVPAGLLFI